MNLTSNPAQNKKREEKREFKRFRFKKIIKVSTVAPSPSGNILEVHPQTFEIFSHDISEGGMRIDNLKQVAKDAILKVNVELTKNHTVETLSKVIWVDRNECGLSFMSISEEFKKSVRQLALRTALSSISAS
jgi:hypothetical protein